jgi:hypothetical protein
MDGSWRKCLESSFFFTFKVLHYNNDTFKLIAFQEFENISVILRAFGPFESGLFLEGKLDHGGARVAMLLEILGELFGRICFGDFGNDGIIILRKAFFLVCGW